MAKELAAKKAKWREAAMAARAEAHAHAGEISGDAMRNLVGHVSRFGTGRIISAYLPIRSEISPLYMMRYLHAHGQRICVPVIEAPARPLRFRAWSPNVQLEAREFGVEVPVEGDWLTPEIVIAPLLAFDKKGRRLGYGGGFYDRTLEKLRAEGAVHYCGLAYDAQEIKRVPSEATDLRLDAIVTEKRVQRF